MAEKKQVTSTSDEVVLDLAHKDVKETKVDFEKFNRTKPKLVQRKQNKIGMIINKNLQSGKPLLRTWLIIGFLTIFLLAFNVGYITFLFPHYNSSDNIWKLYHGTNVAACVLAFTSIAFTVLPYLFLILTFFVGINEVYRSRTFHYYLWFAILIALLLWLASFSCGTFMIVQDAQFFKGA